MKKDYIRLQSISQSFIWKPNIIKSVMINIWYQYVLITYENICTKTSLYSIFENLQNQGDNYILHIPSPQSTM